MGVRKPAKWMQPADDRLLEFLDEYGTSSVSIIDESNEVDYAYNTIAKRLRVLREGGLVEKRGEGTYRITGEGTEYLAGTRDLRDVEEPE